MPIMPFEDTGRQREGLTSYPMQVPAPDEIMRFRGGGLPQQLSPMGIDPEQLKRSRDKIERILSNESLTPKEFGQLYRIKLELDDQIDRMGQMVPPQQGDGLLSGLMQPSTPPMMPGRRHPMSTYGQPIQPGRGAGQPGADFPNMMARIPGTGGLLRGLL